MRSDPDDAHVKQKPIEWLAGEPAQIPLGGLAWKVVVESRQPRYLESAGKDAGTSESFFQSSVAALAHVDLVRRLLLFSLTRIGVVILRAG